MKVIKKGSAMRVIFFYPGEEGTYVDHADVTLYENGIVHIISSQEETTTHLQNCEILWRFETEADERSNKVRLLKPRPDPQSPSPHSVHGSHGSPHPHHPLRDSTGRDLQKDSAHSSSHSEEAAHRQQEPQRELKVESKPGKISVSKNPDILE